MTDRTYPQGVPCWVDTEQPDVEAASRVLRRALRLDVRGRDAAGRAGELCHRHARRPDVGRDRRSRNGAPAWNTYIAVDDADVATE